MTRRPLAALAGAIGLTVPWIGVSLAGTASGLDAAATVALSGLAVLGTSFLLAWAAEAAERDVPRAFAIAVLAVAPEYAVDALYAWEAGQFAGTARGIEAGSLAVANMTGANRILIGVGWSGIALLAVLRGRSDGRTAVVRRPGFLRDAVRLDRDVTVEIAFLGLATLWAFLVPLNGGIGLVDSAVLVGLYACYVAVTLGGDVDAVDEHHGVPGYVQSLPRPRRIAAVLGTFAYAGVLLLAAVKPFAHGLETLGTAVGLPPFFVIQWVAPLASEAPELVVVAYLVARARTTAGFNALLSSKLNQWTLLVGTLVLVYSLALGQYGTLPFDRRQAGEIWLTAAQSLFALALLVDLEFSIREALALSALFLAQVLVEFAIVRELVALPVTSDEVLLAFGGVYLVAGCWLFLVRRDSLRALVVRTAGTVGETWGRSTGSPEGSR